MGSMINRNDGMKAIRVATTHDGKGMWRCGWTAKGQATFYAVIEDGDVWPLWSGPPWEPDRINGLKRALEAYKEATSHKGGQ